MVILKRVGPLFFFLFSMAAVLAKDMPLPPPAIVPSVLRGVDPSIASDGRDYLAVWIEGGVRAARVDRSGELINRDSFVISEQLNISNTARVTWIGSAYLIVYGGSYALVSSSGDVIPGGVKLPVTTQFPTGRTSNARNALLRLVQPP